MKKRAKSIEEEEEKKCFVLSFMLACVSYEWLTFPFAPIAETINNKNGLSLSLACC